MKKMKGRFNRCFTTALSFSLAAVVFVQPARADDNTPILTNIQDYTNQILSAVNNIPAYLTQITQMAISFMATDNSGTDPIDWSTYWTAQQSSLTTINSDSMTAEAAQYNMQKTLETTFFGDNNLTGTTPNPQNVNDLSYLSMLGQPLVSSTSGDPAMNYLINASGMGAPLTPPSAGWRGDASAQKNYLNFYNTITAVQTYNGFVLSRLLQDSKTAAQDFGLRKTLIEQTSDSNWFSSVISNDLGWVLRQLLLYTSQSYVLLDQLVQTQKQMSASLAMTNSLFIVSNEMMGSYLLKSAQGG